ncbi:MAG: tetratricopeptide repeat protein, partial [Proteobacteria bacterium]
MFKMLGHRCNLKTLLGMISGAVVAFSVPSFAQSEDGNRNLLIDKLGNVYQNLAPNDSSKVAVTLRLADLYAERARINANKELEGNCATCTAGDADRKKALKLYTEVLDRAPESIQGKVMVQVGHLYQMTGDEARALQFYQKIIA